MIWIVSAISARHGHYGFPDELREPARRDQHIRARVSTAAMSSRQASPHPKRSACSKPEMERLCLMGHSFSCEPSGKNMLSCSDLLKRLRRHIRRPLVWMGGLLVTAVGSYITGVLQSVGPFLSEKATEVYCELTQKNTEDNTKFKILIAQLADDPDHSSTKRLTRAVWKQDGFQAVQICTTLDFDFSEDSQTSKQALKQRAMSFVKKNHADLMLFGYVDKPGETLQIYAMNEDGGCDLDSKAISIALGKDFTDTERRSLINTSLQRIQAACRNQESTDWPSFSRRISKLEYFIQAHSDYVEQNPSVAVSYLTGLRFLYTHRQGEDWLRKGKDFFSSVATNSRISQDGRSDIAVAYGQLLDSWYGNGGDAQARDTMSQAYDLAINLNPSNPFAYSLRGDFLLNIVGNEELAKEDYDKAIHLDKNFAHSYIGRGFVALANKDIDNAKQYFDKAINLDPKSGLAYSGRGAYFNKVQKPDLALVDHNRAVALDPELPCVYADRGDAYLAKGDIAQAAADYDKALSIDATWTPAYVGRGAVYRLRKEFDAALASYAEALRLNPRRVDAYEGRGLVYMQKKNWDAALEAFDRAIAVYPNYIRGFANRGTIFIEKEDWDRAIESYTKYIGFDTKRPYAYSGRARAYMEKSDFDNALSDMKIAINLSPDNADLIKQEGFIYSLRGNIDEAIRDLSRAIELSHDAANDWMLLKMRASSYGEKKQYGNAIADIDAAIAANPQNYRLYADRGYYRFAKGDIDLAISDDEKALTLNPKDANTYSNLGYAYRDKKEWDRSLNAFEAAMKLDSSLAAIYAGMADVYKARGDLVKAIESYDKAISLNPKYVRAYHAREEVLMMKGDRKQARSDFEKSSKLQAK
jgi:tetratricopeptide (TPR) repeat protein